MPRVIQLILLLFILSTPCLSTGAGFTDVDEHPSCSYCGMNRQMFAHSRMLISYADGSTFGACSLHCAALDFANQIDKAIQQIEVADYATKELIEAESAIWVMGGNVNGVMTSRPKWAFADDSAANAFIKENGGEKINFQAAISSAFEDMYKDTMMIRKKRAAKKGMKMKHGMKPKQ